MKGKGPLPSSALVSSPVPLSAAPLGLKFLLGPFPPRYPPWPEWFFSALTALLFGPCQEAASWRRGRRMGGCAPAVSKSSAACLLPPPLKQLDCTLARGREAVKIAARRSGPPAVWGFDLGGRGAGAPHLSVFRARSHLSVRV